MMTAYNDWLQSLEVPMSHSSSLYLVHGMTHRMRRLRSNLPTRHVLRSLRRLVPVLLPLALASVAHAQGTMDFSGAQTLMGTFKTFAIYAGAVICFGGLIFAGIRMMSGRFQDAIPGLFGALFGAGVLGWGAGWIGSLTGQSM